MPANLTPQYRAARNVTGGHRSEDKLAALREMLAIIPSNRGPRSCRRI